MHCVVLVINILSQQSSAGIFLGSCGYMLCNGDSGLTEEVEVSLGTCHRLSKGPLHSSTVLSGSYLTWR